MDFVKAVAMLAACCFLLGFVIGLFAKYFYDTYCIAIEDGVDEVEYDDD